MTYISYRAIHQNQTHIFSWCCSVVTATSDCSILWICSDRHLFALGTNGRTGRQCADLHITAGPQIGWYTELHSTGILQGMCGRSVRITAHSTDKLSVGAMFMRSVTNIKFFTSLKLTKFYNWQQLLIRKTDKLRKKGIFCWESEGYTDLNRERPVLM